jgi:SAM-dependent methyltransferase
MSNNLTQTKMFENKYYWGIDRYIGLETERIIYAASWIPADTTSVLDVGCGNGILVNILKTSHLVAGVDRSYSALLYVEKNPCQADVLNLPFANQSFDVGIGTEVMEHLPINVYKKSLSEICRVSRKYILITVPYKEDLVYAHVECPTCKCHFHPDFHMQSFNRKKLASMFSDIDHSFRLLKIECIFPFWNLQGVDFLRNFLGIQKGFPSFAICPQCGYSSKQPSYTGDRRITRVNKMIKEIVKRIWPFRKKEFRWLIALYAKEDI